MTDNINLSGRRLKSARLYRGLTQTALADAIGVTQSNLSFLETNRHKTNDETTKKLAAVLDVTEGWLRGETVEGGVPEEEISASESERKGISARFIEAYNRLQTIGTIQTDAEFSEFANIPKSSLSLALAGKNNIPLDWVPYLEDKGASRDYIYNNRLPMLRTNKQVKSSSVEELQRNIIALANSIEEDMKILKTYISQLI